MTRPRLPLPLLLAARRLGVPLTRDVLWIRVAGQQLWHFQRYPGGTIRRLRRLRASTSRFGIGQQEHSNRTPLGLHRVARKIGDGWPTGAIFKGRVFRGYTWQGDPEAKITDRILWLEGLEPGFNRGGDVDSFRRYIYVHGTGDELTLGRPATCGCTHLADRDLVPLFNQIAEGTLVWISAR